MNTYNDSQMREYSNNSANFPQINTDLIPKIRVAVRKRPLNRKEALRNEMDIIDIRNSTTIVVKELK